MRTIDIMIVYIHPIGEEARDLLILLWLLKSRWAELCKVVGRGGGGVSLDLLVRSDPLHLDERIYFKCRQNIG